MTHFALFDFEKCCKEDFELFYNIARKLLFHGLGKGSSISNEGELILENEFVDILLNACKIVSPISGLRFQEYNTV